MPALRWAAAAAVAGILAGDVAVAAADPPPEPSQTPVPVPTASPTPTPVPDLPFPTPEPTASGTTIYVITVTTTTTAINAPITWVAAPVTTNVSNGGGATPAGSLEQSGAGKAAKLEVDLRGCGASSPKSKTKSKSSQHAQLRLPKSGTLLLRVNGKRVGSLRLPSTSRGVPLRIVLGKDGMLTVRRPSGSVLHVQACTASKEAS